MGIYGLTMLYCKGVEESLNRGDETHAPPTDTDDVAFPGNDPHDDFDIDTWEPVVHTSGVNAGIPAMPTTIRPSQEHREQIPLVRAPFNAAVARSVGKQEMYSCPSYTSDSADDLLCAYP